MISFKEKYKGFLIMYNPSTKEYLVDVDDGERWASLDLWRIKDLIDSEETSKSISSSNENDKALGNSEELEGEEL